MINRRRHPARRRAFTLIESMATVAILATLGSIASFVLLAALEGYVGAATSAQLHAELSIALDRATREIRMIELDPAAATPPGPNITEINKVLAPPGDNIQWTNALSVTYNLYKSDSDLRLDIAGNPAVLLSDVTAFSVQTYDKDNALLADPITGDNCDEIRRVELDITVQRNGVSQSLRSKVFIRSTMSGAG